VYVDVALSVGVNVGVSVSVGVSLGRAVLVGESVGVNVGVTVGVSVSVGVLVTVGVMVGVFVVGQGSGSDEVPLALIIQLPDIPSDSAIPRMLLLPRLSTLGGLPPAIPANHERNCDGGVVSRAVGRSLGTKP